MPEGCPASLPEGPSQSPGRAARRGLGPPPGRHTCAWRRRKLVLHSVSHRRTERGSERDLEPSKSLDIGPGLWVGRWRTEAPGCLRRHSPKGGQSRNALWERGFIGNLRQPWLCGGEGRRQTGRASVSTQGSTGQDVAMVRLSPEKGHWGARGGGFGSPILADECQSSPSHSSSAPPPPRRQSPGEGGG